MKIKDVNRVPKHMTSIGGQALMEGILMRGPKDIAIAVRKPDNEIELKMIKLNTLGQRHKVLRLPFIRGVVSLIDSLSMGIKALMYSSEFVEFEDEDESKETWTQKIFKDKAEDAEMVFTLIAALILTIALFIVLPMFLTNFFKTRVGSPILMNLIEGIIRIIIFFIYIIAVTRIDEVNDIINRVFEYHGAEHKSIHAYENGEELTVENVQKHPILHPRCGTSFLVMVMIISILVLSFFGWPDPLKRFLIRLLMLPVIMGISYEINRLIGKSNSKLAYYISYPGLFIQKIATVREPDDSMVEVAITALKAVIPDDEDEDQWK